LAAEVAGSASVRTGAGLAGRAAIREGIVIADDVSFMRGISALARGREFPVGQWRFTSPAGEPIGTIVARGGQEALIYDARGVTVGSATIRGSRIFYDIFGQQVGRAEAHGAEWWIYRGSQLVGRTAMEGPNVLHYDSIGRLVDRIFLASRETTIPGIVAAMPLLGLNHREAMLELQRAEEQRRRVDAMNQSWAPELKRTTPQGTREYFSN
jgi:hypothetical protein